MGAIKGEGGVGVGRGRAKVGRIVRDQFFYNTVFYNNFVFKKNVHFFL